MIFKPLASSSRGNAYLIQSEGVAPLLLEAGVPIKQLRELLWKQGVAITDLAACLISHEHGDHSKAVKDLLKAGVDCYMSVGTAEALGVHGHHRVYRALGAYPHSIRDTGWSFIPFPLKHDAKEPRGFLVARDEKLLFIPDTGYVENRFPGVNLIAVECNHVEEILARNIEGGLPAVVGRRVRRNHMSLGTLIEMLKANDLSDCREIWLLHLSDGNSDEALMIQKVRQLTGREVRAAK